MMGNGFEVEKRIEKRKNGWRAEKRMEKTD